MERDPSHVQDMQGVSHDLDNIIEHGQAVALVFWQTWCASCKREAPDTARAARTYKDDIKFFGVVSGPDAYVDDDKVRSFVSNLDIPYPQIRDRDLTLTKHFGVKGTPTVIVLGRDMEVLYRGHRLPDDWKQFALKPPSGSSHAQHTSTK